MRFRTQLKNSVRTIMEIFLCLMINYDGNTRNIFELRTNIFLIYGEQKWFSRGSKTSTFKSTLSENFWRHGGKGQEKLLLINQRKWMLIIKEERETIILMNKFPKIPWNFCELCTIHHALNWTFQLVLGWRICCTWNLELFGSLVTSFYVVPFSRIKYNSMGVAFKTANLIKSILVNRKPHFFNFSDTIKIENYSTIQLHKT